MLLVIAFAFIAIITYEVPTNAQTVVDMMIGGLVVSFTSSLTKLNGRSSIDLKKLREECHELEVKYNELRLSYDTLMELLVGRSRLNIIPVDPKEQ